MAIFDSLTEFADASTDVQAAAGTVNVGSTIDLGATSPGDIARGRPLYLVISTAVEIITGGAAGTLAFQLVSDSGSTPSTDGTQTIHFISDTFVTDGTDANDAFLKAGKYPVVVALPLQGKAYERYLGVQAVIGTTTITAGAVDAYLTFDPPRGDAGAAIESYADATN